MLLNLNALFSKPLQIEEEAILSWIYAIRNFRRQNLGDDKTFPIDQAVSEIYCSLGFGRGHTEYNRTFPVRDFIRKINLVLKGRYLLDI